MLQIPQALHCHIHETVLPRFPDRAAATGWFSESTPFDSCLESGGKHVEDKLCKTPTELVCCASKDGERKGDEDMAQHGFNVL